jgi:uncharacterized membrane protein
MQNWWLSLSLFEKVVWLITLPVTVVFLIQMILTFAGMDSDGFSGGDAEANGMEAEGGEQPFQLFTFRNFINFLLGFGWTVIAFNNSIESRFLLVTLGVVAGVALVALVMFIFYKLSAMVQSGTMNIHNAVGQVAEVYLSIPAAKSGTGKVHVKVQGTLRELEAMTEGEQLQSGQRARVTGVVNDHLLMVSAL